MPAKTGNKNALKHGLYSGSKNRKAPARAKPAELTDTLIKLQRVLDRIDRRLSKPGLDDEDFARLANSFSAACTAIFNGHRTLAFIQGNAIPLDEALKELQALDFQED